jgi:hypothetical protein
MMTDDEIGDFYIRYHDRGYDVLVTPAVEVVTKSHVTIKSRVDDSILYEEEAENSIGNEKPRRDLLWVSEYNRAFDDFNQFDQYYRALKSNSELSD